MNDGVAVVRVLQSVDEIVELSMVMVMTKEEPTLQFDEKSRSIRCREDNHLCEKGHYETYGFVRGNQLYSTGIHHVRVRFEKTHRSVFFSFHSLKSLSSSLLKFIELESG